jgi:hypothetical protein
MNHKGSSSFLSLSLILLVGIFYLNFISRIALAPFLPIVEIDLGLGHGEAGSLFFTRPRDTPAACWPPGTSRPGSSTTG